MLKKIHLIVLLFIVVNGLNAQSNFRSGYIIKNEGDTIKGFLEYRMHSNNTVSCNFKKTENSSAINYEPKDVKGYRFDNDSFYQSKNLSDTSTVFMEMLVWGEVDLYLYNERFFVQKGNSKLHELKIDVTESLVEGTRMNRYSTHHIGILNSLLSDCEKIKKRIPSIKLYEKQLTILIQDYNVCVNKEYIGFKDSKPWIQFKPGLMVGISHSRFKMLSSYDFHRSYTGEFSDYNSPMGGLTIKMNSPRISERLAIHLDVLYQDFKFSRNVTRIGTSSTQTSNIDLGAKSLAFPFSLSYSIIGNMYSPFFKIGASHILNFDKYSSFSIIDESSYGERRLNGRAISISENQWGIWSGLGLEKTFANGKTGLIELRGGISDIFFGSYFKPDYAKTNIYSLQLLLGFRL